MEFEKAVAAATMDFGPPDPRPDLTPAEVSKEINFETNHRSRLYLLFQKSDRYHFKRLAVAFPQEAREYLNWFMSEPVESPTKGWLLREIGEMMRDRL